MTDSVELTKGLEGVVAANSAITFLDGAKGRMIFRGYDILDLAGKVSYEEVIYLLWEGDLPKRAQLETFAKDLAEDRALPPEALEMLRWLPKEAHPMDALRTAVSFLGALDPETGIQSPEANRRKAERLVARLPTITAAWDRLRRGQDPVPPDPSLGHAENFLFMLTGQRPDPLNAQAVDLYLSILADHELNASTFAGRVVISTLSDVYSAVTASIGALKGPLHGGANEAAMKMFLLIGDESCAEAYVEKALAEKRKIMGFGHRVYKVEDPRSGPLKAMSLRMAEARNDRRWYDISVKVAETVFRLKKIYTNVDFYSASVLYMAGIRPDLFTPLFAISRVAGWTAHIFEQLQDNRLIRPVSDYVGPPPRIVVPLAQRG